MRVYLMALLLGLSIATPGISAHAQEYKTAQATSQTPALPSETVLIPLKTLTETARHIALLIGHSVAASPLEVKPFDGAVVSLRGNHMMVFTWDSVNIIVDGATGRFGGFGDWLTGRQTSIASAAHQPALTTREQAITATAALVRRLPLQTGEWKLEDIKFSPQTPREHAPDSPAIWEVKMRRWVNGSLVQHGFIRFNVSGYDGSVLGCTAYDTAVVVPPVSTIVSREQAERVALETWGKFSLPADTVYTLVRPRRPVWSAPDDRSEICRLTYLFDFDVPAIPDPQPAPTNEAEGQEREGRPHGRGALYVRVAVDAETGEMLYYGNMVGSGSLPRPKVDPAALTPRPWKMTLFYALDRRGKGDALTLGAMGAPALQGPWMPSKTALRFTESIDGVPTAFALERGTNTLLWKTKSGVWAAMQLAGKSAAALAAQAQAITRTALRH